MSSSIQAPGRRLSPQAVMTSENAVLIRMSKRLHDLRSDLDMTNPDPVPEPAPVSGMIPLGLGAHQAIIPLRAGIGNTPFR
jgi:hypothetical protein